jgi:hypothetical protein
LQKDCLKSQYFLNSFVKLLQFLKNEFTCYFKSKPCLSYLIFQTRLKSCQNHCDRRRIRWPLAMQSLLLNFSTCLNELQLSLLPTLTLRLGFQNWLVKLSRGENHYCIQNFDKEFVINWKFFLRKVWILSLNQFHRKNSLLVLNFIWTLQKSSNFTF